MKLCNFFAFSLGLIVVLQALLGASGDDAGTIITESLYNEFLKHLTDSRCEAHGFYTYNAFVTAARAFPAFGTTGDDATRKRELAAFFGQTSHETTGGTRNAPDEFEWGYCFLREQTKEQHCDSTQAPCPAGKQYYGRGPIQLTSNSNYQLAGQAIQADLINNPDLVATDPVISFKTAIWFWMTAQGNKPSCHDVITNAWKPTAADSAAGRAPGYGVITNIINGGLECGSGPNINSDNRIGFYKRYCDILKIDYGSNLDCANQQHF
ncbi:hypothetical protein PIB30_033276 [Stylosanthes scabra]|uniref:Glycoside hydrolase family 19 catalytic domain-containing protein n=1 Tax=Stylosanthes scabra TaxID=79078 RepID=A0ABU6QCM9_9FABA|nr:hypothetical protein [Stylosanthes scabra]